MSAVPTPTGTDRTEAAPLTTGTATIDLDAITSYLNWWFDRSSGTIAVTAFKPNVTSFHDTPDEAARAIGKLNTTRNVYVRQTTLDQLPDPGKRGSKSQTYAVPGVWLDVDIAGPNHKRTGTEEALPLPDNDTAHRLIGLLPEPTVIVHSGGGLYPLWKFTDPIDARDDLDRADAYLTLIHEHAARIFTANNCHIDNVSDLARVLRAAGSLNHKSDPPQPVRVIQSDGPTWTPEALAEAFTTAAEPCPEPEPEPADSRTRASTGPRTESVADTFENSTTLADVLPAGWDYVPKLSGHQWECWNRPGSTSEYSVKRDRHTGAVIVWSDTVASELGIKPGSGVSLWQLHCKLSRLDPKRAAGEALKAANDHARNRTAQAITPLIDTAVSTVATQIRDRLTQENRDTRAVLNGTPHPTRTPPTPTETGQLKDEATVLNVTTEPATIETATHLPESFWDSRAVLRHIQQAAHARLTSADAVLADTLAGLIARTPPSIVLPPLVGSYGSLNYITALVGPPGAGKSTARDVADDLLAGIGTGALDGREWLPIGSGEGIAEAYYGNEEETGDDGKKRTVRKKIHNNASFYADEGETVTELGQRKGSTLLSAIRKAFSGSDPGAANATHDRTRILPKHSYRFTLVLNIQPELAAPLLDDTAAGTPQRIVWASATDPAIDEHAKWPGPLKGLTLRPNIRNGRDAIDVHPDIVTKIRADRLAKAKGDPDADPSAHGNQVRLKTAAGLSLLEDRVNVTIEDWHLAGQIQICSEANVAAMRRAIDQTNQLREIAATNQHVNRTVAAATAVDDTVETKALHGIARAVARKTHRVGRIDRRTAQQSTFKKHRDHASLDDGIEHAISEGWIISDGVEYIPGPSQPA